MQIYPAAEAVDKRDCKIRIPVLDRKTGSNCKKYDSVPLPIIGADPSDNASISSYCRMGFLSMIVILLLTALAVEYFISDESSNSQRKRPQHHHHQHNQENSLSNDIIAPNYLALILRNTNINNIGFNISEKNQCFKRTLNKLIDEYKENQLLLLSFLWPNDTHNSDSNGAQMMGGYGGYIDIYCTGNVLVSIESGASTKHTKFPKYLDVGDLIDMNLISTNNSSRYGSFSIDI